MPALTAFIGDGLIPGTDNNFIVQIDSHGLTASAPGCSFLRIIER